METLEDKYGGDSLEKKDKKGWHTVLKDGDPGGLRR